MEAHDSIETYLKVGVVFTLQLLPTSDPSNRTRTLLRGWVSNEHLIVDWPQTSNALGRARGGQQCVVRFISSGKAIGFTTVIASTDRHGKRPSLYLEWPSQLTSVGLRRYERASIMAPCTCKTVEGPDLIGEVHDVSEGGCGVWTREKVSTGAVVHLSFNLPDGSPIDGLRATVRNATQRDGGYILGCQHDGANEDHLNAIALFVASQVDSQRVTTSQERRVAILESDTEVRRYAKKTLEESGYHVIAASNMPQLIQCLKPAAPTCLLFGMHSTQLPIEAVKQLLSESEATNSVELRPYVEEAKAGGGTQPLHALLETLQEEAGQDQAAGQ